MHNLKGDAISSLLYLFFTVHFCFFIVYWCAGCFIFCNSFILPLLNCNHNLLSSFVSSLYSLRKLQCLHHVGLDVSFSKGEKAYLMFLMGSLVESLWLALFGFPLMVL